jgi:hypothetical protein
LHEAVPTPPQAVICGAPLSAKSPQTPDVPLLPSAAHWQPLATELTEQILVEMHTAPEQQSEVEPQLPQ